MSRIDNEVRVTPSVLDRLLDYEPEMSQEAPASRSKSLRLMKQALKRDLEWLLNSRQIVDGIPPELVEVTRSVAAYGLPDFTGASSKSPGDLSRLRRALEGAISYFEPRLEGVTVTLEAIKDLDRGIRFRIDGRMRVEPAPEPVTFDTQMSFSSGAYVVREV